jgi:c-di-GMP-binding flagellar brake protein YcgR
MAPEAYIERRRDPRVPMEGDQKVGLPVALTVRLVDISAGGVLLSSSQKMNIGQRAKLRTTLGSDPFHAEIEVRRVVEGVMEGSGRGGFRVGAVFTSLDEAARRSVTHFLSGGIQ